MIGRNAAVVVAFDGLIADTLELRARSIVEGLAAAGMQVGFADAAGVVAGRTIDEAVRACCMSHTALADETLIDIASHRANRICSHLMREPVALRDGAAEWLQRAAPRLRIVVRSDSVRQQVEPLLDSAGLTMFVSMLRCSDDRGPVSDGEPSFVKSWNAILDRLQHLSVVPGRVHGLECALDELCSRVPAARIRRAMSVTEASVDTLQLS